MQICKSKYSCVWHSSKKAANVSCNFHVFFLFPFCLPPPLSSCVSCGCVCVCPQSMASHLQAPGQSLHNQFSHQPQCKNLVLQLSVSAQLSSKATSVSASGPTVKEHHSRRIWSGPSRLHPALSTQCCGCCWGGSKAALLRFLFPYDVNQSGADCFIVK